MTMISLFYVLLIFITIHFHSCCRNQIQNKDFRIEINIPKWEQYIDYLNNIC